MAKAKDELLDHNYDGIQEYDNPMPGWWVYLFLITIVWGVAYLYYYHVSSSATGQIDEYLAEVKAAEKNIPNDIKNFKFTLISDQASLESGKVIYEKNCVSCHGKFGEGNIGPNLTDKFWIHGGSFENVVTTILEGVPAKSMISWKTILKPVEVQKVASYVWGLYNTNPPNPKPPQGDPFERQ